MAEPLVGGAAKLARLATEAGHVGEPAILKVSRGFEAEYGIAARVERNLWLERDRWQPDYGGRPWTLWTANSWLRSPASDSALRWVAAQP